MSQYGSLGLPYLFDSSNEESKGLPVYKLEVSDVFRGFDVEGWASDLFVLGPGHQQHPKEAPSRGKGRPGSRKERFSYLAPLLAQAAPCGAPEGTGSCQPQGIGILVASKEGTTMVFSL